MHILCRNTPARSARGKWQLSNNQTDRLTLRQFSDSVHEFCQLLCIIEDLNRSSEREREGDTETERERHQER